MPQVCHMKALLSGNTQPLIASTPRERLRYIWLVTNQAVGHRLVTDQILTLERET
jgi:hypothetical protein